MRRIRSWLIRLMGSFGQRRREADLADEFDSHLQLHIDDNVRAGMSPADARRVALIGFGGVEAIKEAYRDRWSLRVFDRLAQDVRQGMRQLRSGTSLTAVGMLCLAIGLTTAMFAIVDALLLHPVPFREADRLAWITMLDTHGGSSTVSPAVLNGWRAHRAFEAVEGVEPTTAVVDAGSGPVTRTVAYVTPGVFEMLGQHAIRGRLFDGGQEPPPTGARAVISEDLWRGALGADPAIIGRRFTFNQEVVTVVGILPAAFRFPEWNTQIWRPRNFGAAGLGKDDRPRAYLRLAKDVSVADALRIATDIAHRVDPSTNTLHGVRQSVSGAGVERYYRDAVPLLVGGVGLVFLALCANVSCLLLARFTARRRQFGLCSALGASRPRLLAQAFVEAAIVAGLGAVAGVALAHWLVVFAAAILPEAFLSQTLHPLRIDAPALVVATTLGCVATLMAGLLPAWMATRGTHTIAMGSVGRSSTETRGAQLLTRALLVAEVALACTLLISAGLLGRSFLNLARMDRGFDPRGLMTVSVVFGGSKDRRLPVAATVEDQLRSLPGIAQIVWSNGAPMNGGQTDEYPYQTDTPGSAPVKLLIQDYFVGPDFFSMYRMPMLKGRSFEPGEDDTHVILGTRMAAALWPQGDPVGRTFTGGGNSFLVIGIAKEPRRPLLSTDAWLDFPTLYRPFIPGNYYATVTARCRAACPSEGLVRQRLLAIQPPLRSVQVQQLEDTYQEDLAQPRATAAVGLTFAAVALVAAAGGLFSVLQYAVGRRRREFGIRTALGSSALAIGRLVFREGAIVIATGISCGALLAWLLERWLASVEYGVTASDPVTWIVVIGTLGLAGLLASWWPARSAMRVNPVELLRED